MFSTRTPSDLTPNRLSIELARKRGSGARLYDLTESNPTRVGLTYPRDRILAALRSPRALRYEPDARGLAAARAAVADYYGARGVDVGPERVVLTASTSEAYALLFKLLADAGDAVLVPVPSYPLVEHLARVECVEPVAYPLAYDGAWHLDVDAVSARVTPRTRAVVVVSPNNPTGSILKADELAALVTLCRERDLALISDEVFADYVTRDTPRRVVSVAATSGALTFALNGLSKIAGLPQLKLGWIVVNGPADLVEQALARLEFAADLFLSVATPVQRALPALLALAPEVRAAILERVVTNRSWLEARVSGACPCDVLPAEGGWYAIVRTPRIVSDEQLAVDVLANEDVVVHPGFFFDFPREGVLVLSLLPPTEVFCEGVSRTLAYVERLCG